jgi:hypothetical protein
VVCTDIGNETKFHSEHGAVAFGGEIHIREDVAPMSCGQEGLGALLYPLDR